jgi:hypothetical protein
MTWTISERNGQLFRYFLTNYPWNLSVDLSIEMGARIGEIEEMCAPLQEAARSPDAAGTRAFRQSWVTMADKLITLAEEDEERGRLISAGDKRLRAAKATGGGDARVWAGAKKSYPSAVCWIERRSPTRKLTFLP